MRRRMSFRTLVPSTLVAIALSAAPEARADVPFLLPVQGHLELSDGTPVDGLTSLTFQLYATATSTAFQFYEVIETNVEDGYFSVYLGEKRALPAGFFRDSPEAWLGMTIGQDAELQPRVRLASVPFSMMSLFCAEASTLGGATAEDFALAGHSHDWSELTSVPAELLDGDQDTTYSAGLGISLSGSTFEADLSVVQSRVNDACPPGQYLTAIEADGSVTCTLDQVGAGTITEVVAGSGLSGGGTAGQVTVSADTDFLQRRVTGTCPAGQSIRAVAADGTVTCEADDDSGGTVANVIAGTGLSGGGTGPTVTLSVDNTQTQRRVGGSCGVGSYIRAIAADGSVTCGNDENTLGAAAVSAEFTVSRNNSNGTSGVQMVSATRSFCFLTRTTYRDIGFGAESGTCNIVTNAGNWRLEASVDDTLDGDVTCSARCLTW